MPWKRRQLDQSVAPFRRARGATSRDPALLTITVFIASKTVKRDLLRAHARPVRHPRTGGPIAVHVIERTGVSTHPGLHSGAPLHAPVNQTLLAITTRGIRAGTGPKPWIPPLRRLRYPTLRSLEGARLYTVADSCTHRGPRASTCCAAPGRAHARSCIRASCAAPLRLASSRSP